MNKTILFILLYIIPNCLLAQTSNWGAFFQKLNAKPFAGKRFKIEAVVKVELIDTTANAEIWVRVDKTDKKVGFFNNMMDKPIRTKDWKTVFIEGKVDEDAEYISFGGLYNKKGFFYFDNFKFSVKTTADKFEVIPISNGNFEADSLNIGWTYRQNWDGFYLSTTKDEFYEGKQALKVNGSKIQQNYSYGNNDSAGKYIHANGIKLYYETYGQGEPLLLLHGNSQSIESFKLQIPEFSEHYQVIAVDTRGQGKTSEDGKRYTYDLFAEDMKSLLDSLHLDSVNVLGWSDGGNTGLIMAMKYPKKVKRLVTMGANVFIDSSAVEKWVFDELNKQLKELKNDTSYGSKKRIRMITLLLTEPKHSFDELKTITCPVLVMAGEKDVIKENHTTKIAANITNSTLFIVPKETHYYPWENATEFNKTVLYYLMKN